MISIIMPVYNTQNYLKQSIESVLKQTYKNIELILIDDGSTDNSANICKEYARFDVRVKYILQENNGAASARNTGILNATMPYILFLDSDDWYNDNNMLQTLLFTAQLNNADVLCFNYKKYFEDKQKLSHPVLPITKFIDDENDMIKRNIYNSCPWNKLIKKDIIINNNLFFETGKIAEDILWNLKLYSIAQNIIYKGDCYYVYRQRANSISHIKSLKHIDDLYNITSAMYSQTNQLDKKMHTYIAYQYCTLLINAQKLKLDNATWQKIYAMKDILNNDENINVAIANKFNRLFGIKLTAKALYAYSNMIKR